MQEAPAVAVFTGLVPLSVFAATAVWAFEPDRERRFLLLMTCLAVATLAVSVLGAFKALRGVRRTADVVAAVLHEEPERAGPPPALPRSVPGRGSGPLLTWAQGTAFAGGLVGFWFLGVGEPWEDGRLHSTGELWVWGGALAVIGLYCALNVEGAVSRVLPGRTRAVRGTVRNGQVVAAGEDPRGPLRVDLRIGGTDPDALAAGMEGRDLWLCWELRRVKRDVVRPGPPRLDCAALLVFDGGRALRGRVLFPPGRSPWAEGAPTGSAGAPVDPARAVAVWSPRDAWPLTLPARCYGVYALVGLCAAGLFVEGLPRGLLAVGGAYALLYARTHHSPPMCERALAPAWYRDRSGTGPDTAADGSPLPAGHGADPAAPAQPGTDLVSSLPVERAEPGPPHVRRALRRVPALVALATLVPLLALVALAVWVMWPGREERIALTAWCLVAAAAVLAVLLVHRLATGRISPHEVEVARAGDVPGPPVRRRLRKGRYLFGTIGVAGWIAGLVVLIPAGDVTTSPLVERLRADGAVVAEVTVEHAAVVERHYGRRKGSRHRPPYAVTERLTVRLPTDSGSWDFATVRTRNSRERVAGDRIAVIYAPGNTALGAYAGIDEVWTTTWEGYPDDLQRLLDDRALSGKQLLWLGLLWLVATGVGVFVGHAARLDGRDAAPSWPLTAPYTSFVTAALALAGSALLLTDRVLGVGRLGLGAAAATCALISITTRFATPEPEESGPAHEGATA